MLSIDISETQYRIESGQAQKITLFQLISADTADLILFSDWLTSLKLCSDWLVNLLQEEFQLCHSLAHLQIDLIAS